MIFGVFCTYGDLVKINKNHGKTQWFFTVFKDSNYQNSTKIDEQLLQVWIRQKQTKKSIKNWVWKGLGIHSGRVWDALESLLNDLGRV